MIRKVLLILLALVAVTLGISSLMGIRPFVLRSSSMEPTYHSGDLVFADTGIPINSLNSSDVIVYQGFTQELTRYQGDNTVKSDNASATVEISSSQLIGRAVFSIPWLGNAVEFFLQHQYLAWILIAGLFISALLPRTFVLRLLHRMVNEEKEEKPDMEKEGDYP